MEDLEKLIELENLKWLAKPALEQIDIILNYVFDNYHITSVLLDGDDLNNKYVVVFISNDGDDSYFSGSFDLTKEAYEMIEPFGDAFYELLIDEFVDNLIDLLKTEKYVSYKEAQLICKTNNITTKKQYKAFVKENPQLNLPLCPDKIY